MINNFIVLQQLLLFHSLTEKLEAQKQADSVSADFSRSTMDTLAETKDAMKAMQENFVLIESSLKSKNEHLLKQLEEREIKLAESDARILSLESGAGIQRHPDLEDLLYKIEKLEKTNHDLQDEKYELQKSIAELQEKIIASQVEKVDDSVAEKNNKIVELEALIQELKSSEESLKEKLQSELEMVSDKNKVASDERDNKIVELEALIQELRSSKESLKEKLQSELETFSEKNNDNSDKLFHLEKQVETLSSEKAELIQQLSARESDATDGNDKMDKLSKELDEANKAMIKLKAQHKSKLKNMQKQLENFKKVRFYIESENRYYFINY